MTQSSIKIGDTIRVLKVPPDVGRYMPQDTQELFLRCVGQVLRVEGIDDYGGLELLVLDDGTQAPDHCHHTIFIEPEYVELVTNAA